MKLSQISTPYGTRKIFILITALVLALFGRLNAQSSNGEHLTPKVSSPNEETSVDLSYYIECRAISSDEVSLLENTFFLTDSHINLYKPFNSKSYLRNYILTHRQNSVYDGNWVTTAVLQSAAGKLSTNRIYTTGRYQGVNCDRYRIHLIVPNGYEIYWRPAETEEMFRPGSVLEGEFSPPPHLWKSAFEYVIISTTSPGALPGKVMPLNGSDGEMRFALGFLPNGKSAGYIDFHYELRDDRMAGYAAAGVPYPGLMDISDVSAVSLDPSVEVITNIVPGTSANGVYLSNQNQPLYIPYKRGIRQVVTPQAIVDIRMSGQSLVLEYYNTKDATDRIAEEYSSFTGGVVKYANGKGPFRFSGVPFVKYKISSVNERIDGTAVDDFDGAYGPHPVECGSINRIVTERTEDGVTTSYTTQKVRSYMYIPPWPDSEFPRDGEIVSPITTAREVHGFGNCLYVSNISGVGEDCDMTPPGLPGYAYPHGSNVSMRYAADSETFSKSSPMYDTEPPGCRRFYGGKYPSFSWSKLCCDPIVNNLSIYGTQQLRIVEDGGFITEFGYYDHRYPDPLYNTHNGRMKWRKNSDGSWSMFEYSTELNSLGLVIKTASPWLDAAMPAVVPTGEAEANLQITNHTYGPDWEGVVRLPYATISSADGKITGWSRNEVYLEHANDAPIWITMTEKCDGTQSRYSVNKIYKGPDCPSWLYGLPYMSSTNEGQQESAVYHKGDVDANGVFTKNVNGKGFRSVVLKGLFWEYQWDRGIEKLTKYDGVDIDLICMIPNVSTAEVTIRDARATTVRTETLLYTGNNTWTLIDSADMRYDTAYNLIYRKKLNGTVYTAVYAGGRKQSDKDESGVTTTYGYDDQGRVISTTRLALGEIPELKTSFTYDNDNRLLSTTLHGDAETGDILSTKTYDLSGRVIEETTQGLSTTYDYTNVNGILTKTTVTLPGGATRIIENYRDGRTKSITGTAGPAEYYTYKVEDNGYISTTKFVGESGTNSPRWTKTTTDWLGQIAAQFWPAADGSGEIVTRKLTYNWMGLLSKEQTADSIPTVYFYDHNAVMYKYGTAKNGDDNPNPGSDRMNSFSYGYRYENGSWWNYSETRAYPPAPAAPEGVVQTKTWTRVTNFQWVGAPYGVLGNCIAESIAEDPFGNRATTQTFLDSTNGTITTVAYALFTSDPSITITAAGKTLSQTSATGVETSYKYDKLGRLIKTIDRTTGDYAGNNITYYSGTVRTHEIIDNLGVVQHTYIYDTAGRLIEDKTPCIDTATGALSGKNSSHYSYSLRGQLLRMWGDVNYPVRYEYDDYGQRVAQYTFRTATGDAAFGGDKTSFAYDPASGLLLSKTDPKGKRVTYSYNKQGQVATRSWARGVTTRYSYNRSAYDALSSVTYDDGTPGISYKYDSMGRLSLVKEEKFGSRTFSYRDDSDLRLANEDYTLPISNVIHIVNFFDDWFSGQEGRPIGVCVWRADDSNSLIDGHDTLHHYDIQIGRLYGVWSNSGFFGYDYLPNSNLISSVTSETYQANRIYETNRNLVSTLETTSGAGVPVVSYTYTHDALGRRMEVIQDGQLYSPYVANGQTMKTAYGYNKRNELTTAQTTVDGAPLAGRKFGYAFDPIGNRTSESIDGTGHSYTANELNQYTQRQTPSWLPISGVANRPAGAQVEVNGSRLPDSAWKNRYFYKAEPKVPFTAHLQATTITAIGSNGDQSSATRHTLERPTTENFTYDDDGNLTCDGLWRYAYDAENRLRWMRCLIADENGHKISVEFSYDYMGRRRTKEVYNYTGTPEAPQARVCTARSIFVYKGWTLLAEYADQAPSNTEKMESEHPIETFAPARFYTWGPDLSGTMGGAGDIGGLLAIQDLRPATQGVYLPVHDGNGNVMAITKAETGEMVAAYEYDPFGNLLRSSGSYAKENPFRFSGKYYDNETGLTYSGFRYYSASLGRFINRDPLEERGGWALYKYLNHGAADPYAGASGVAGTSWLTEWGQAQDRLLANTSLPHTTQAVTFDTKKNNALPGATQRSPKTYSANATGHYAQGGVPGSNPQLPSGSVANPAAGNANINLYAYAKNNPINSYDALGLTDEKTGDKTPGETEEEQKKRQEAEDAANASTVQSKGNLESDGSLRGLDQNGTPIPLNDLGDNVPEPGSLLRLPDSPGYKTRDAAAMAVLNLVNPLSIKYNREIGGTLYKDYSTGKYHYTNVAIVGTRDTTHPGQTMKYKPDGGLPVGGYHTHGAYSDLSGKRVSRDADAWRSDMFSSHDISANARVWSNMKDTQKGMRIDSWDSPVFYLGTPSGVYRFNDPGRPPPNYEGTIN